MRGAFLNCRLAVNGIQNALRSLGATSRRLDTGFSLELGWAADLLISAVGRFSLDAQPRPENFDQLEKR
jgi:hypothetical protein